MSYIRRLPEFPVSFSFPSWQPHLKENKLVAVEEQTRQKASKKKVMDLTRLILRLRHHASLLMCTQDLEASKQGVGVEREIRIYT
jgi:hypothetical protein